VPYFLPAVCPKEPDPCPRRRDKFGRVRLASAISEAISAIFSALGVNGTVLSVINDPPSFNKMRSDMKSFSHRSGVHAIKNNFEKAYHKGHEVHKGAHNY
jgi:hypothetical protein